MRFSVWLLMCIVSAGFAVASAKAQQDCVAQARDNYEVLYCQIKAGGEGAHLPSLADFRRNPPETQALLLRRPAARLGLPMPALNTTASASAKTGTGNKRRSEKLSVPPPSPPGREARPSSAVVADCTLTGETILCANRRFDLALNRSNRLLAEHALSESNRLIMPSPPTSETGEKAYLIDAYQTYIEKMLEIGLGASTMSFSKFYYTYQTLKQQNANFPARMATMFDYLKRDKAAMSIKTRYHDQLPADLKQCDYLGRALIVCDEGEMHWVFRSRKP